MDGGWGWGLAGNNKLGERDYCVYSCGEEPEGEARSQKRGAPSSQSSQRKDTHRTRPTPRSGSMVVPSINRRLAESGRRLSLPFPGYATTHQDHKDQQETPLHPKPPNLGPRKRPWHHPTEDPNPAPTPAIFPQEDISPTPPHPPSLPHHSTQTHPTSRNPRGTRHSSVAPTFWQPATREEERGKESNKEDSTLERDPACSPPRAATIPATRSPPRISTFNPPPQ